ncbi:PTPLA-domain-containing protein [Serendipita vermifera]|nr:PTPLA-domain-containing protein [Serendipita vermifera]
MPRTTRRADASASPDYGSNYDDEPTVIDRVGATGAVALEKAESTVAKLWHTVRHYIPRPLRNREPKVYYLLFYNSLTFILWSYLLLLVTAHLSTPPPPATVFNPSPGPTLSASTASETLAGYLKNIFTPFKNIKTTASGFASMVPPKQNALQKSTHFIGAKLHALRERSYSTYSERGIGVYTIIIQNMAILEVLHSYLRLVRSPLQTTVMQVVSRLLVVWWYVESQPAARTSSFYSSMLIAWSFAEMIRSLYYIASLVNLIPPQPNTSRPVAIAINVLTTIRYTAFYVLYPLGAGSEYALLLKGFPSFPSKAAALARKSSWAALNNGRGLPAWRVAFERVRAWIASWDAGAWLRVPFVFIWPISLYILMSYMHSQRKKALGGGPGRSVPGGRLRDVGGKAKRA